jgi:hypothetical protein
MPVTKIKDDQLEIVTAINGMIEIPLAKDYTLSQRAPFPGTLQRLTAKSTNAAASGTLQIKINDVAVTFTGGAFVVSGDTEVTDTISAGGAFAIDDTIKLTVSAPSDLDDLSFTLEYER